MRHIIAWLRTMLFNLVFFSISLFWVLFALLTLPLGSEPFTRVAVAWSYMHRVCARWLLGQRVVIEGRIPDDMKFCVLKHEAMFETLDLPCLLNRPVVAAKRELLDLPLWGRAARAYGLVPVDREAGAPALRRLRGDALSAIARGRPLCLFAEGTRVPHGERPPLKSGFAGLYTVLRVPVVPVALDSGKLNVRGRFIRYPGIIRYRFGEAIPPGLKRADAEARVHAAINALNS